MTGAPCRRPTSLTAVCSTRFIRANNQPAQCKTATHEVAVFTCSLESIAELFTQPGRYAAGVGRLPRAVGVGRPAPAVVPLVVSTLAVKRIGLTFHDVHAQARIPSAASTRRRCETGRGFRPSDRCLGRLRRRSALARGTRLGRDRFLATWRCRMLDCAGTQANDQTQQGNTCGAVHKRLSSYPDCRWLTPAAPRYRWPAADCGRPTHRWLAALRETLAQPVGLVQSSTGSVAASLRRHRSVPPRRAGPPR
ncbi:hypothetical protein KPSA1_02516 [Pseudomonas syringae pv. actinidiae]|uniref:Uncharacterized protein n=1 Tax=Pseudomonas syringae pv. actinidiae TaxID=103796 RepID=A0A2V0QIT2_PSESF|nr:hypothetical protein KPSA1_02516 [Pseudomonas syringae pv. actinidiae]